MITLNKFLYISIIVDFEPVFAGRTARGPDTSALFSILFIFLFYSQASKGLQLSPVEVIANSLPNIIPNVLLNKREVSETRTSFCDFDFAVTV